MAYTPSIRYRSSSAAVVLRQDLLELCEGNHCAAMVLGQMLYWHDIRERHTEQAQQANRLLANAGQAPSQEIDTWVYKSQVEMKAELLGLFGETAIAKAYRMLLDEGYLQDRQNPHNSWDKTRQYRVDWVRVQKAINALPEIENKRDKTSPTVSSESTASVSQNHGFDAVDLRHRSHKSTISMSQDYGDINKDYRTADSGAQTTAQTTATAAVTVSRIDSDTIAAAANETAENPLVQKLSEAGVNRKDAIRLAASDPAECERQLEYLPFVTSFRSSKGAYLRSAIEQGFGPPEGWLTAQKNAASREKVAKKRAAGEKKAESFDTAMAAKAAIRERIQAEHPDIWKSVVHLADALLPPPIRSRPDGPAYQPALIKKIDAVLASGDYAWISPSPTGKGDLFSLADEATHESR